MAKLTPAPDGTLSSSSAHALAVNGGFDVPRHGLTIHERMTGW